MGKPYSEDLRLRVIDAVETEEVSRRGAAARFGVSVSAALNWVRGWRVEGCTRARAISGDTRSKLTGQRHRFRSCRSLEVVFSKLPPPYLTR
jgi:putative transposase